MSKQNNYTAIWPSPSGISLANVSFTASSDAGIRKQVRTIARQIGFKTKTCQVWHNNRLIMSGIE